MPTRSHGGPEISFDYGAVDAGRLGQASPDQFLRHRTYLGTVEVRFRVPGPALIQQDDLAIDALRESGIVRIAGRLSEVVRDEHRI